jgi:hypothetical protein
MPLEYDFDVPSVCPWCGFENEAMANMTGTERPTDGDVTMCMECGILGVVDTASPTGLRKPNPIERAEFLRDPDIKKMLWAWQIVDDQRRAARRRHSP